MGRFPIMVITFRQLYDFRMLSHTAMLILYLQERYNLSSPVFDIATEGIFIYGYGVDPATSPQPYDASDIIIVSQVH